MTENCSQGHVNSLAFLCDMGISVSRGQRFSQEESEVDTWKLFWCGQKVKYWWDTCNLQTKIIYLLGKVYLFSEAKLINTKIHTLFNQFQVRTKCTFLNSVVFSFVSSNVFIILIFYSEIVKRKMNIQNFHIWRLYFYVIRSDQMSHSVVSYSLQPHESQHARPPCPSPTPRVHSDSRASSQWCHPAISSSVVPFSSCPQSLPASESFPMSQLFAWGSQSTGVSALASFLPKKSQGWSPSEWTGWISLQSKGLSRVFSNTTVQKHQLFSAQPSSQSNSPIHTWPQEKP